MEDKILRDRIVCGVGDNALRRQLLQKKNLTLQSCVAMCRASEATARHLRVMGGGEDLHMVQNQPSRSSQPRVPGQRNRDEGKECQACGLQHGRGADRCPACGKTCAACGKLNHCTKVSEYTTW